MFGVERQQEEQQQPAAEWACASGVLKLVPPGGRTYQCGCVFACLRACDVRRAATRGGGGGGGGRRGRGGRWEERVEVKN